MQLARMIWADFVRGLRISTRYPIDFFASIVTMAVLYLGVYWTNRLIAGADMNGGPLVRSLTGFVMWYFVAVVVGSLSTNLQSEAEQGTLEQLMLTPASPAKVLLSRLTAVLLRGSLEVALVLGVMVLATGVQPARGLIPAVLVMGLSLVGLAGFGYTLAGLTLVYKRVAGLSGLLNLGLLLVLGVFNSGSDGLLAVLVRLLPLAYGNQLVQEVLGANPPTGALWTIKLATLAVNSLVYLSVGLFLFRWGDRKARRRGVLAQF